MNNRREEERAELYKGIEKIANDLRGSVDGWDFKQYIFGFMFYRYISEKMENEINNTEHRAGNTDFEYANITDEMAEQIREDMVETYGYFILPSELFRNVRKTAKDNENLNTELGKIFKNIEASAIGSKSEKNLKGLFDDLDVSSNKLGSTVKERNKSLVGIMDGIGSINFGEYGSTTIDAFGDAYEHLMGMYAKNAGRSGGEYFTPQEVSSLLTHICVDGKTYVNKVYDPTCGSGSLLLQSAKILGKDGVKEGFYGQEKNITTYNLCRINMFLHDIGYEKFDIQHGDTLLDFKNAGQEPFDIIVSNPPYSLKWDGDSNPLLINDERYAPAGVLAPKGKADLAFIMHILNALSPRGTAAVVSFPGVMYRGGAEQKIRKYLIDNNFVDTIIQLPEDLFYGTSISTCIMVLKKNKTENKTLFIDASDLFVRAGKSNKLTEENIQEILEMYKSKQDIEYKSRYVENSEIAENKYNLSVATYVIKEDTREIIDIDELNSEIEEIVEKQQTLRAEITKIISEIGVK